MFDDYEKATGDVGINDSTKKTILMQLLRASLRVATRDTLMAARQTFVSVSAEYLETIIVQRCEFDEAAMGSAIPMDAGAHTHRHGHKHRHRHTRTLQTNASTTAHVQHKRRKSLL